MTDNSGQEAVPNAPSGHVFDTKPPSKDAVHNNKKEDTNAAAVTESASTAASSAPSAQEIAPGSVVSEAPSAGSGSGAGGDPTSYSDAKMPPSALRPNKTRRYSGTSEDFAGSASNDKGEDEIPDTAAAVAIAGNRVSGLTAHSSSAASSGAGSDTSSRRASVNSNEQSNRKGSGPIARMQRRLSNEGSLPSDVDDTHSRRSSAASRRSSATRRSSALLSWGRYV